MTSDCEMMLLRVHIQVGPFQAIQQEKAASDKHDR
jgi:hypothetical protein